MKLIDFFLKEEPGDIRLDILIALGLSGLAHAGILFIINTAKDMDANDDGHVRLLILFIITVYAYIASIQYACETITVVFENVIHNIRRRLIEKISDTDLIVVERIGQSNIYDLLVQETKAISEVKYHLIWTAQACFLLLFVLIYIAFLSKATFLIGVALGIIGIVLYWNKQKGSIPFLNIAVKRQVELGDGVSHILDGFSELKINRERRADLNRDLSEISVLEKDAVINSDRITFSTSIFNRYYFLIVWGVIILLIPKIFPSGTEATSNLVAAVLFIFGPISTIMGAIPELLKANLAAERIEAFEKDIDKYRTTVSVETSQLSAFSEGFSQISMNNVEFTYFDMNQNPLFTVGPLTLAIQAGAIHFVVGGNGSGKSTLAKLLTALYYPDRGELKLDNEVITPANAQDYRQLFSIILSNFHLFPKIYGVKHVDTEKANRLLHLMQLEDKTQLIDNHFTNLDLSTGQKKRIALIITFLEDSPIYVFDEWAADQDPDFRRYFYEVLLRELKAAGKTVIAISHDDRYFHVADRIIKMDYGRVVE